MAITKILLCGKRCAGKTTLFWDLQKSLNWPIFAVSEYLREYIHRYALTAEQVEEKSEEVSRDYEARVMGLMATPDHVIVDSRIFGRMAELGPHVLKVLLYADDATRVTRAAYRQQTPVERQRIKLLRKESEWITRMEKLYPGVRFFDPAAYDLSIDTTHLTPKDVLERVLAAIGEGNRLPPAPPDETILFQGSSS